MGFANLANLGAKTGVVSQNLLLELSNDWLGRLKTFIGQDTAAWFGEPICVVGSTGPGNLTRQREQ